MRSTCFFALVLVLLSGPALSQEPAITQARNLVWLERCPEADSSDVEDLKARIDCLADLSEAMADSQNLLLQNMFLLLEEQFLNEPAKIVERIPAVAHEAKLVSGVTAASAAIRAEAYYQGSRRVLNERRRRVNRTAYIAHQDRTIDSRYSGVPTVVNCVPPLTEKPGFVLVGAKLSNWTNRQVSGGAAISECTGRDNPNLTLTYVGSRSRSEGCYVNRTWFDWYTRRAASEGWPTDEATLCRDEAEERFEEMLGNARLLISDRFEVWLDGDRLLYVKDGCFGSEERFQFFLHVTPVDPDDLSDDRKQHGFDVLDVDLSQVRLGSTRRCAAALPLPDYPVAAIRTGQFDADGDGARSWEGVFSFTGGEVPQS